jgi:DNA-binding HxlR family transcriptional regulator
MSVEQQLGAVRAPSEDTENITTVTQPSSHPPTAFCPRFHHAVEMIGRRWTGAILRAMLGGAARYSDIAASIPGLSDRLLSERLRELESEDILTRTVIPEMPVRVEYHLTEKGQSLLPVLEAVSTWAEHWIDGPAAAAACDAHEAANPETT